MTVNDGFGREPAASGGYSTSTHHQLRTLLSKKLKEVYEKTKVANRRAIFRAAEPSSKQSSFLIRGCRIRMLLVAVTACSFRTVCKNFAEQESLSKLSENCKR